MVVARLMTVIKNIKADLELPLKCSVTFVHISLVKTSHVAKLISRKHRCIIFPWRGAPQKGEWIFRTRIQSTTIVAKADLITSLLIAK